MPDQKVLDVQNWMNNTYSGNQNWKVVDEDGETGIETVTGLIRALQIELGLGVDGSFGPGTKSAFNSLYPNGLSKNTVANTQQLKNINVIVNGGLFCRGIAGDWNYLELFSDTTEQGIITMKTQLGLQSPDGIVRGIDMKAILTTDAYTTSSNTYNIKVREIQQALNRKYLSMMGDYLATNGLYDRNTNKTIKMAVQYEIGVTPDGSWGNGTKSALPALSVGSSRTNLVYLLQYLLFLNGFDPNGFDGSFGNGARSAVMQFQELMHLEVDGSVGPQTWFALAVSCGDTSRSANACDTRFEITAERARVLKQNGYEVVGRYINGGDFKELRDGELERIFNAGLKAFFIYQENNRLISDFSYEKGVLVGNRATECAKKHKLLKDSIIYFAVDLDVYEEQINGYIIPYFKGIQAALNPNYKIGIYGPRLVCSRVSEAGLSISSFVADMSSGYSCNIGQKIPNNWCYDQYVEISNFNGDFDIDKVTYNGKVEASSNIESGTSGILENQSVFNLLSTLYQIADEYCLNKQKENTVLNKNILVLQFFRDVNYDSVSWNTLVGGIEEEYIEMALQRLNMQSDDRKAIKIKVNNGQPIDLIHLSVVIEGMLRTFSSISDSAIARAMYDLFGWAGDLIQVTSQIASSLNNPPSVNELMKYIGAVDESYNSGFYIEDFIQDIDAVNLHNDLKNTRIDIVFKNYYDNEQSKRYSKFFYNLFEREGTPEMNSYNFFYEIAKLYLRKENSNIAGLLSGAFHVVLKYQDYDADVWAEPMSIAFAKKMSDICGIDE